MRALAVILAVAACGGPRPPPEVAAPRRTISCPSTGWIAAGAPWPDVASPISEAATLLGTDGVARSDACLADRSLDHLACEEEVEPEPPGIHDHSPRRRRLTGRVVSTRIDCDGRCRDGACAERCPAIGDELAYVAIEPSGAARLASPLDPRQIVCALHADLPGDGHDCRTSPRPGDRAVVTASGMLGAACTGGAWGAIAVAPPASPGAGACTYSGCTFAYDAREVPPARSPPAPGIERALHAAWTAPRPGSFVLGPHVVDPATDRVYLAEAIGPGAPPPSTAPRHAWEEPATGITAIEASTGRIVWLRAAPLAPLAVEEGRLLAAEALQAILLDPATGATVASCGPGGALRTATRSSSSGTHVWRARSGTFLVTHSVTTWFGGMPPPPGTPSSTSEVSAARVEIGPTSCALVPAELPEAEAPDLEVRRRTLGDEWELTLHRPGRAEPIAVLGRGPAGALDAGGTLDGAHVAIVDRRAGAPPRIALVHLASGERIGELALDEPPLGLAVSGQVILLATRSAIRGIDLATGRELWRHALPSALRPILIEPLPP